MTTSSTRNTYFLLVLFLFTNLVLFNSCEEKDDDDPVLPETGTMTDIDGNVYTTVKIGNQWWMSENLKVTRYRNGFSIPNITDSVDWVNQSSGGYCIYDNDNGNTPPPGFLYNFYAVANAGNLAPEGWHIPTDDEWKQLERTLGMSQQASDQLAWRGTDQANKLRSNSSDEWSTYGDIFSTNESGFTALAGSCRLANSYWGDPGLKSTGFWWTSSSYSNGEGWYRYLDYKNTNVFRSHIDQHYGFSVRCVKD
ncbi:MAG TPA: fibrobacter succinogenes major paralogous domain-containing protein [Bacteroidia bacterium]|nr:fibrobacter succinogenes major paralogous domain-containing protein [Bacteroidia bacterium]